MMKKLFFTLFACAALFASCSSDNDAFSEGDGGVDKNPPGEKLYPVSFDLKSDAFTIEQSPLRSSLMTRSLSYVQIIAYKEAGEVYSNTVLVGDSIRNIIREDGTLPFSLNLPMGNYHLAFIHNQLSVAVGPGFPAVIPERFLLNPVNFYTDVETASGIKGSFTVASNANVGNYYQSIDISVNGSTENEPIAVVLEPMWSTMNISLRDIRIPSNCNFMMGSIDYMYTQYELASKLAPRSHGWQSSGYFPVTGETNSITVPFGFTISKSSVEKTNLKLTVHWLGESHMGNIIMTREIELPPIQIENGLRYSVSGSIGENIIGGGQMNVSFVPFNEEDVVDLPFE